MAKVELLLKDNFLNTPFKGKINFNKNQLKNHRHVAFLGFLQIWKNFCLNCDGFVKISMTMFGSKLAFAASSETVQGRWIQWKNVTRMGAFKHQEHSGSPESLTTFSSSTFTTGEHVGC